MTFTTVNPATGLEIARYPVQAGVDVLRVVERAGVACERWRLVAVAERAKLFESLARVLDERKSELAVQIVQEMGKPLPQAVAEIEKCAAAARYYAADGEKLLGDQALIAEKGRAYVHYEPLGVILAIMPWNFPLWQVLRCAIPAMMAGNAVVLKHSPNVTGLALEISTLFARSGFPEFVFQTVVIDVPEVETVIAHPAVAAVSLTGSTRAGRSVAALAGRYLKKCVLELGGSDAYVILDDADLELAAEKLVTSRLLNAGQSCVAAKRWIVTRRNRREFEERVFALLGSKSLGDPMDRKTAVGPLARKDLRDQVHTQVQKSLAQGARLRTGGIVPDRPGFFYPPTLLVDVKPGQAAFDEEIFGPVIGLIEAHDENQAIELANKTSYGLGAGIFSRDLARAEAIARERLRAGNAFVNEFVRSDPRWPFGGIKDSGYGRELASHGLHEFVNAKTVFIA